MEGNRPTHHLNEIKTNFIQVVWRLDENNTDFEVHIKINDMLVSKTGRILKEIEHFFLIHKINHVKIQFEYNSCRDVDVIKRKK